MLTTTTLVQTNVGWLKQAIALLEGMGDDVFTLSPPDLAPHRVAGHLRHIIEFYECFISGLTTSFIDYDSRKRDGEVERSRSAAIARIHRIGKQLEAITADRPLYVRMEDAEEDCRLSSSINRELQVLSSHTIHHFALIAVTLRAFGVSVTADFGVAPSTLRYQASKAA